MTLAGFMGLLLSLSAIFLILIVLVQRGRGGGLTGALGGMGGQSAFGAKAGDLFTKITVGTAVVWILLCVASVKLLDTDADPLASDIGGAGLPPAAGSSVPSSPESNPTDGSMPISPTTPISPPGPAEPDAN